MRKDERSKLYSFYHTIFSAGVQRHFSLNIGNEGIIKILNSMGSHRYWRSLSTANIHEIFIHALEIKTHRYVRTLPNLGFFQIRQLDALIFKLTFTLTVLVLEAFSSSLHFVFRCFALSGKSNTAIYGMTCMIDGNFGNVSAGVLILNIVYQCKRW